MLSLFIEPSDPAEVHDSLFSIYVKERCVFKIPNIAINKCENYSGYGYGSGASHSLSKKGYLKNTVYLIILIAAGFLSCKKEQVKYPNYLSPTSNAGPDQQFTSLPDSVILDGSASTGAGGKISAYEWREISGPTSSVVILNASSVRTVVKNFSAGLYQFELKVFGSGGLYARDTVQIQIWNSVIQAGTEYILQSTWKFWTDAMGDDISAVVDPSNSFSIASLINFRTEVSIQLDSSSVWTTVPEWDWYGNSMSMPHNNGYLWEFTQAPYQDASNFEIENYPLNYQLINKPLKVKVKFY